MTRRLFSNTADAAVEPQGLWAELRREAARPAAARRGWHSRLGKLPASPGPGLYAALAQRVDPAQYRPVAVPDIAEEEVAEGGQQLTIIHSPRGTYLQLTAAQRAIWHQMDGTRTVAQLATGAFLQFKQLLPVGELVQALRAEGFLVDRPVGVYRALAARLEERTAEGWGRRVLRVLAGRRFELRDIDGIYGAIYRFGGWLLFTPVFALLWLALAVAGASAFALMLTGGVAQADAGGVPTQVATLWLALLVSFFLHESAHALAVKHFGRRLRGGGMMLYYGLPAFYVDTSDIWRSRRLHRVIVSAAGPMSDLLVGGLAAGFAWLHPEAALAPVATKLAFTCYIATLMNANPLLELDGYFILVDVLRLPDLRQRALAFVRGPLWQKLRLATRAERQHAHEHGLRGWLVVSQPLSRDERIFALYGALATLYAAAAVWFALQFWQRWIWGTVVGLWASGGALERAAAAALVLFVIVPVVFGLVFVALGGVRSAVAWLIRNGYGRRPDLIAWVSGGAVLIAALLLGRGQGVGYGQLIPLGLWVVAAVALLVVRPDYQGAAIAPALGALAPATVLAGFGALLRLALPGMWFWQVADGAALLLLLLAAFTAQLEVSVRFAPQRVQLATALMLMAAFGVGGLVMIRELTMIVAPLPPAALGRAAMLALLAAAPAYFGALALALLLPYIFSLADSRLIWSWGLMWMAAAASALAYITDLRASSLGLDVLASGLWAASWITHLATLRQIAPAELAWDHQPGLSESERLVRAFQMCYAGCYRLLRAVYGARRTQDFDDRMDVLAATANWGVRLDRDLAEVALRLEAQPLDVQGARFAEVLRYTVSTIEDIAGASFARRTIQAAYDALPWPERETAGRLCFPDTPWARELSGAFGDAMVGRMRLLREVEALLACDDDELLALARSARTQRLRAGEALLHAGDAPPGVWIVEAGEVLGRDGETVVAELHRASAVGVDELTSQRAAAHSFYTSVESTLLFIPAAELIALIREAAPHAAQAADSAAVLRLLERVPIFADLPRGALRSLAQLAEQRSFAPRSVIIRQDKPSGVLYVIQEGGAAVMVRAGEDERGQQRLRLVNRLGAEEFFGELELIDGTPPRAYVLAATELRVLALPHQAVRALAMGNTATARGLEQVGSARKLELRTTD
ncbi:cyclic nucleotide-binding domain-containing protein [Chloroflexia bacterium SDU3-3]|nr:cyclic nucleotide-binding domain-containing protein [Chloroflexia bacterium SDU3-3]